MVEKVSDINYKKYVDQVVERLEGFVNVPSVLDPSSQSKEAPYGQPIADALDYMAGLAEEDGLTWRNVDGYALVVEPSQKESNQTGKRIDIISHVDVVEVGDGWTYNPFQAEVVGNVMYGRGTSDMKRAGIIMETVLKIIADHNIPLKNDVRLVYGTDEETDMSDMPYYLDKEGSPDFAITPDGTFPISKGEKGASTWRIQGQIPRESMIVDLVGGSAANVIPSRCKVTVDSKDMLKIQAYREKTGWPIEFAPMEAGVQITVKGRGGHASEPEVGINAVVRALQLVVDLYDDAFAKHLLNLFKASDGSGIGIATRTQEMGALTINLGSVQTSGDGQIVLEMDSRFPENTQSGDITEALKESLPAGFEVGTTFDTPAVLQDVDRPAFKTLTKRFKKNYPNHDQSPYLSSGVTYSKVVPNCLAFGMAFEGDGNVAHQSDEYVRIDNISELLALYTQILVELGQADAL